MDTLQFYLVDVFAEQKYAGNQLAVIRKAGSLSDAEMQAIARETNFAETTFILSDEPREGGFDVRIFTPAAEIPFAGHPTLGTAFVIQKFILGENAPRIVLNLGVGKIPVDLQYEGGRTADLWMKQIQPTFGKTVNPAEVAPVLGIAPDDIDLRFPIEEVSTGLPYFIVPMKSLAAVRAIQIRTAAYQKFIETHNPDLRQMDRDTVIKSAFFVFTRETYHMQNDVNARMFDPWYGIPEDAATGSANGCLLAYLLKHRYFGKAKLDLRVEQGYEMQRPSLIKIRGRIGPDGQYEIFVGGRVQFIAGGRWQV